MIKRVIFIAIFILALTLVSAITIYSGESYELELEKPFDYYSIVGNSTEVILEITQNGNNVTITPSKYSEADSYEIIFFDKEKETITVYRSSGGGGGRTIYENVTQYVDRNITEYIDREVEIPGEITEVEKIVVKYYWGLLTTIFILAILLYLVLKKQYRVRKEEIKDE